MNQVLEHSLSEGKMFIIDSSQLDERYDPYYLFHKLNTSLASKYPSERLGSLVKTFSGGTPSKDHSEYWNGNIPWASPKDFTGFELFETEDKITEKGVKNSSSKIAPINSVLIVVRSGILAHTFPVCINRVPTAINQDLKVLIPKKKNLLPKFLGYYFFTFGRKLLPLVTKHSTTVHSINTEQFEHLEIPVPPIKVQKNIISLFEKALDAKAQKEAEAEELLTSIDDYLLSELGIELPEKDGRLENRIFETSFQSMTGLRSDPFYFLPFFQKNFDNVSDGKYELKPIRNLIHFLESGSRPKGGVSNIKEGVWSIGGEHIGNQCNVGIGTPKYIPKDFHQKILRTETKMHDIILVKDGATTGKIGIIINEKLVNQNVNEHVFLIRVNKKDLDPFYLTYYLHSIVGQTQIKREITGATVTGLTKEAIRNIYIPVPYIEKQNQIAAHIKQSRKQSKQLEKEAQHEVENARKQIEEMILQEDSVST